MWFWLGIGVAVGVVGTMCWLVWYFRDVMK